METAAPVAPSPDPTVGAAQTPAMTEAEFKAKIGSAAPDALNELIGSMVAPAAPPAPDLPSPPPEPPAPAAATPEPEPEEMPEIPAKNYRVTPNDFLEAQVILLMKPKGEKPGLTLKEAYQQVYGRTEAPVAPTPAVEPAPKAEAALTAEVDAGIGNLAKEIENLATQIEEAGEKADMKAFAKLQRELGQRERQLERMRDHREAIIRQADDQKVETLVEDFRQDEKSSADAALEAYPTLADPKGEARKTFNREMAEMMKDPALRSIKENSARWPEVFAHMVAAKNRWGSPPEATAQPSPAQPAPRGEPARVAAPPNGAVARTTGAAVITPSAPVSGAGFVPTVENFRQLASSLNPSDLNAALAVKSPEDMSAFLARLRK